MGRGDGTGNGLGPGQRYAGAGGGHQAGNKGVAGSTGTQQTRTFHTAFGAVMPAVIARGRGQGRAVVVMVMMIGMFRRRMIRRGRW